MIQQLFTPIIRHIIYTPIINIIIIIIIIIIYSMYTYTPIIYNTVYMILRRHCKLVVY